MNIVILAAGTGSRLLHHTQNTPKALVKLAGIPLLDYQLSVFKQLGLSKINIVSGYLEQQFEPYSFRRFVNEDFQQSNMLYSLMKAKILFTEGEDLIISYGDIIYEAHILSALIKQTGDIVVSADKNWQLLWDLRMEDPMQDAESFIYDDNNNILELGKPLTSAADAQAQYIGLIKISAKCLPKVVQAYDSLGLNNTKNMYLTDFIQHLIDIKMEVKASFHQRGWLEVDTVEDLSRYEALVKNHQYKVLGLRAEYFQ